MGGALMPQAIASALVTYGGFTATAATVAGYAIVIAGTLAYSDYSRRRANQKARAAANASAKDRELMIRSAIAPRRTIYGRDRVSGPLFYVETTGDKQQYLHLCIALAGHECDAIETVYFNEDPLPDPDVDGYITTGDYVRPGRTIATSFDGTTDGSGNLTLPRGASEILAAYTEVGVGEAASQTHYTGYSHTADSDTITGLPASQALTIQYTYQGADSPLVRIKKHLGTTTQTDDADLVAESDGIWTTDHRARGVTYLYVRLEWDQEVFGSIGLPNISAVVRGKKVYDPRTTTTAWSNNAALCVADWLQSAEGMSATSAEVPDAEVTVAANICDEDIDLELGGATTQKRYTCDNSFTADQAPRDVLGELVACMAGRAVWTEGRWLVRAGAHRTPVLTITADMLAGPLQITPRASRSELFNAVRTTYRDPDAGYAEVQAALVENASYEASDGGVQIVRQIDIPTLSDTYRAQRLAKIELERARQALTVRLTCNLKAYDLAPTDTVQLTLETYGFSAKVFEVIERSLTPDGLLQYTLRETASGVWDWNYGEATVGDLAPNTALPTPFGLPGVLANFTATEQAVMLGDGTIVTQALLEWDQSTAPFVVLGGKIEVQTARTGSPYGSMTLPGDSTSTIVGPLQVGIAYIARVRAIGASGRAGDWAYTTMVAQGITAPPANVANLDWEIKPGQVVVTWDACPDADYAATELRVGGTGWDDATFLFRGAATEYHHPRPANGSYVVRAKHVDTSGVYSATAASTTVTVDDSIDAGTGGALVLTTDRFPFFSFADGTTHTAQAPGATDIVITARLVNLAGSPTITAEAFDSGSASLGAVTLTGSGLSRTLTAAAFVAPGSSGSVRTVVITATLAGSSDTLTVFRQDSTTTAPRIYLSNPSHTVATDENGDGGDYSGATTDVQVYAGLTDDTAAWSFAITPDTGVTSAINGGAGPVTGTASVTVAVSAMTVPDGAVLITASKSGETDLTASFYVTKNEGTTGYRVYWDPRSEIVLPVGADGLVSSYADAFSSLVIERDNGQSDVALWTYSKADTNVVSELGGAYGNQVQVTGVLALGTLGTTVSTDVAASLPAGWSNIGGILPIDGGWVAIGQVPVSTSKVQLLDDYDGATTVDVGASAVWTLGSAGNGIVLLVAVAGASSAVRRSDDGGQTWTAQSRVSTAQAYAAQLLGDRHVITEIGTGARSTVDGITYTGLTLPAASARIYGGAQRWLLGSSAGTWFHSINNGGTWAACTGLPAALSSYGAVLFKGRYVLIPISGVASSTFYYADPVSTTNALAFAVGTLATPLAASGAAFFGVLNGVLYLMGTDGVLQYTTDGVRWRVGAVGAPTASNSRYWHHSTDLQLDYLPIVSTGGPQVYRKLPLLATSEDEGFVTVTASKPGESDIVRALPVRRQAVQQAGFAFSANPYGWVFPATSDGVVTDYSGATITAYAERNGVDDTANWSWSYTTTNLTPASGSTNSITITAMSSGADTGTVTFTASRAGYASITGTLVISKAKGSESSGPRLGAAFSVLDAVNTLIGVRFNTDGSVDVKRGSGGSYTRLTQWAGAVVSGVGSSYWLYVAPRSGTHALSTGTTDSWLALSSARTYEIDDATSGTHTFEADVYIGDSSAGANAVAGYFSMRLLVP